MMTDATEAEQTIVEIGRELARFKAASQQLEVTGENLEKLQDRLVKLAESGHALQEELKASFERYSENIEQQAAAVLADIRALDLAEFKTKMDKDVDSLQQAVVNATSTSASQYEDLKSHVDSRFAALQPRYWLLLAIASGGLLFAAVSAVLALVMS